VNNNPDPTRPVPPAFVKQIPPMDAVKKPKRKPEHTGGLMSHPVLYSRLGGKNGA
jgi:hypothetical protein